MTAPDIAIIGAGAAGLAAARRLRAAGRAVVLFDKGRRVGGRLATRDAVAGSFDHGAQFLRLRDAGLRAEALQWRAAGLLREWPQQAAEVPAWIGAPSMQALAAGWAQGLDVHCGHELRSIEGAPRAWMLRLADGLRVGPFAQVLVTVPAPQAQDWFAGSAVAASLARIRYAPCWTLMWVPTAQALPPDDVFGAAGDGLGWIAREDRKPGRAGVARFLVQADADWSAAHLDEDPAAVTAALQRIAALRLGIAPRGSHALAHRWRYALVTESAQQAVIASGDGRYYAGDGCLGGRVEAALLSGRAAAECVLNHAEPV
jgi:renalase